MKHVLVVDDSMELGRLLRAALLTLDSSLMVTVSPSAEEAMLEFGRKEIDLLVADIRLPGISGLEMVRKLRKRHHNSRLIFITGLADDTLEQQARELDAVAFFRKPMEMSAFLDAVRVALEMTPAPVPGEAVSAPPVELPSFTAELVALRQRLNALVTLLLDLDGNVVAQSGDLPAALPFAEWSGALLAAQSSTLKLASLANAAEPASVVTVRGSDYELALAPVDDLLLVVGLQRGPSALRLALALEELLQAQKIMDTAIRAAHPPVAAQPVLETPPPPAEPLPALPETPPAQLEELEALLSGAADIKKQDVDAFWDTLSTDAETHYSTPDALSYEQAQKLGLAPENDEPAG